MSKAYSVLKVKAVTEEGDTRIITGIASTPRQDRDSDVMDMAGAKFALPIPLLWQHNHNEPIGEVTSATVTDEGIEIVATIVKIEEEGNLKARTDEAWHSIKSGLVKCLSIGFRPLEYNYLEDSYGYHIKEWEWYELSAVTVPSNPDAVITSVKAIKQAFAQAKNPTQTAAKSVFDTPAAKTFTESPVGTDEPTAPKNRPITLIALKKGGIPLISGDTL